MKFANDMDFSLSGFIFLDKDFPVPSSNFEVTVSVSGKMMVLEFDRARVVKFSGLVLPKENNPLFTITVYKGNCFKRACSDWEDILLDTNVHILRRKLCFFRICRFKYFIAQREYIDQM